MFHFPTEPLSFSWAPLAGAKFYQIEIGTDPAFTPPLQVQQSTLVPTFTMKVPQSVATNYYWHVKAYSQNDQPTQFSPTRGYTMDWPSVPSLLSPPDSLAVPIEQIDFSWSPTPGAISYDIQVSSNHDFTSNVVIAGNVRSTQYSPPTALQAGAYYWRVAARNAANAAGDWSTVRSFVRTWPSPDPSPNGRVSLLSPTDGDYTNTGPTFTWTPVRLAAHYEVQFSTDFNFTPGNVNSCVTDHVTYTPYSQCFDPSPNLVWYWRVRPLDAPGNINGLFSAVHSFQWYPQADATHLVVLTGPANGTSTSLPVLSWNYPTNVNIGRFRVTVKDKNNNVANQTDTYANQLVPVGLNSANSPFKWYVQTIDNNGRVGPIPGSGSWWGFTLLDPAPTYANPTLLTPNGTSDIHGPLLTWQPVTGANSYRIWRAPFGSAIYTILDQGLTLPGYRYPSTGDLSPGRWSYYVEALDGGNTVIGTSAIGDFFSQSLPRATMTGGGCIATNLNCPVVNDTPTLSWQPVTGAAVYAVVLATDVNFTNIIRTYVTAQNTLTPIESLTDSQAGQSTYWYAVPCFTTISCGAQPNTFAGDPTSPVWAFRKQSQPVELLTPADQSTETSGQVTFTWRDYLLTNQDHGATQEALGYRVQVSTTPDFAHIIDTSTVVDGLSYTATFNYPEGALYWRVQAVDGSNNLLTWSATRLVTKTSWPLHLTSPTAGATVTVTPTFQWDPRTGQANPGQQPENYPTQYQIEVYRNVGQPLSANNLVVSDFTYLTAYTPTSPLAAGTYGWRVRRQDATGNWGPWTANDNVSLRTFTDVGLAPTLLQPANGTTLYDNTLLQTWTAVPGASQYHLDLATHSDFTGLVDNPNTVMTAYATPVSLPSGTYYWRVTAYDGGGNALGTSTTFTFIKDTGSQGDYYSLPPARILDTRNDSPLGAAPATRNAQVIGVGGVPGAGVSAIVANVTVTNPTASSFLTLWPAGQPQPTVSNLNYVAGQTVPNLVTVKVGASGQISMLNLAGSVNVIIDVVGYYSDGSLAEQPDGSRFSPTTSPARILDTRNTPPALAGGTSRQVKVTGIGGVPSNATAVVMNATVTNTNASSYLTVWPDGVTRPTASNLNWTPGKTVPNLVVVKVGNGGYVDMFNLAGSTDVIFDVVGYFQQGSPPPGSRFNAIQPARLADTRAPYNVPTTRLPNGGTATVNVAGQSPLVGGSAPVPASGAIAVVLNVTVVSPSGPGFLTVYPSDATLPVASNLNFTAGQVVPNLVVARLGADGKIKVYTNMATDFIVDVVGWYAVPPG